MSSLKTRIQHKRDTSQNWLAADPVLLDGEIVIVDTNAGEKRTKTGDGTKRFSELPFDDEAVKNLVNGKANQSTSFTGMLLASGWVDNRQTVSIPGLGASQNGIIGMAQSATEEQLELARDAMLYISAQTNGAVTISASGEVPDVNIPFTIILLG